MTISEFRAWLDGFKEAVGEAPTPEQWAKVLQKLSEVREPLPLTLDPIWPTQPAYPAVFHDPPPDPVWRMPTPVWCGPNVSTTSGALTAPNDPNIRLNG